MQKLWALLFGGVLLGCFLMTAAALTVFKEQWGLPTNIAGTYGESVDNLFFLILAFVGFFYVLTEVLLVWAMFKFARNEPTHRAAYTHGNHKLELAWTIIPAAILLYIAYAQIHTWEQIKYQSTFPSPDQVVQVTARQWEWRMRYRYDEDVVNDKINIAWENVKEPDVDKRKREIDVKAMQWAETLDFDDVHGVSDLHTWKGAKVRILLKTNDIIHSFFLPNLRLKQDALPGKTIPMWFETVTSTPTDSNPSWNATFDSATGKTTLTDDKKKHWEIACAELCGGGHYRMRGRLFVYENKEEYLKWLKYTKEHESGSSARMPPPAE